MLKRSLDFRYGKVSSLCYRSFVDSEHWKTYNQQGQSPIHTWLPYSTHCIDIGVVDFKFSSIEGSGWCLLCLEVPNLIGRGIDARNASKTSTMRRSRQVTMEIVSCQCSIVYIQTRDQSKHHNITAKEKVKVFRSQISN